MKVIKQDKGEAMREQFEKLPEIMEYLRDVEWSELTQRYIAKRVNHYYAATFINGAWYAFQEQQKKIDEVNKYLSCINYGSGHDKIEMKDRILCILMK